MSASNNKPPTTQTTGIKICLLSLIHSTISFHRDVSWQFPLRHLPPPWQGVPSRKNCCPMFAQFHSRGMVGDLQDTMQPLLEHEYVSLLPRAAPIIVLHCWSR